MSECKCGLSKIYPVCDYRHKNIQRNDILREKIRKAFEDWQNQNGVTDTETKE